MTQFATNADLAARLGLTLTPEEQIRADALLTQSSELIQDHTKQRIALVTGDVAAMKGSSSDRIRLKERPIVSVASVVLNGVTLVEGDAFYVDGDQLVRLNWGGGGDAFGFRAASWGFPWWSLVVTYTHGYNPVPALAKQICMEAVVRVWGNPGSVIQENIADTQTVYAPYSAPPRGLLLTAAEKAELTAKFGRSSGSITLR